MIDILTLTFSFLGFVGSIMVYIYHDRKIKKQEERLNELQIREKEDSEKSKKQAKVECNIVNVGIGSRKIRFYNSGMSDARNIRIEILNEGEFEGIMKLSKWGPYDLLTSRNGYREESFMLCEGHTDVFQIKILWDDDYAKDRSLLQSPQVL